MVYFMTEALEKGFAFTKLFTPSKTESRQKTESVVCVIFASSTARVGTVSAINYARRPGVREITACFTRIIYYVNSFKSGTYN